MLAAALLLLAADGVPQGEGQFPAATALPVSLAKGALAACAPISLGTAVECLKTSISGEEMVILVQRIPARRFRPELDCEIETAWHLGDRKSPMGQEMDKLLGIHRPGFAAGMIISELQARWNGDGMNFEQIRKMVRAQPRVAGAESTCTSVQS
ncbi:MAG: hypothetical protein J7494_10875 [Sphingobium sp.]|nr:hypothetical protein [Sphingobium sp.]